MVVSAPAPVIWHDLECGSYSVDLPLWRELAQRCCGPGGQALDIGAGTGRVTIELARAGHTVSALDVDPVLVGELAQRASGLAVEPVCADARDFELEHRDHCLCLVPMQTVQLLRGATERRAMLERARGHMRGGALLALAIVTAVDEFDARRGGLGPAPDSARIEGELYVSRPVRVAVEPHLIRIERERFREGAAVEHDLIELERLSAQQLTDEGRAAGFAAAGVVAIAATREHSGSEAVLLRA
ncbi:MAG: class I SAM-dependent methyltransferase [Solirubrobacteraceae bacterium]